MSLPYQSILHEGVKGPSWLEGRKNRAEMPCSAGNWGAGAGNIAPLSLALQSEWLKFSSMYWPCPMLISVRNRQGLFVSWDFTLRLDRTTEKGTMVSETVNIFLWLTKHFNLILVPWFSYVNRHVPEETLFYWSHLNSCLRSSKHFMYQWRPNLKQDIPSLC